MDTPTIPRLERFTSPVVYWPVRNEKIM